MTLSRHTKGPWHVGTGTGFINQVAIEPAIGCAYGAGDEVLANARLMAAAPEMLDALQYALPYLMDAAGMPVPKGSAMNTPIRIALEAMLHEFGQTYLPGSSRAVDLARAALSGSETAPPPPSAPSDVILPTPPLPSPAGAG